MPWMFCLLLKKKKLNENGLGSTIHNVDTVWQYQDSSACVYMHSCYLQGLSKGKETHGQAESPQHRTRCITNAAFHWGTAQAWQHEWRETTCWPESASETWELSYTSQSQSPSITAAETCSSFLPGSTKDATDIGSICCFQSTRLHLSQQPADCRPAVLRAMSSAICTHINQEKQD